MDALPNSTEALPNSTEILPGSMEVLPAERNNPSFQAKGKLKKKLKVSFLGSPLAHVRLSDFALHGLPVPLYTHCPELVLLFKNHADCADYLKRLNGIKDDL